jgi:hypothetical protein
MTLGWPVRLGVVRRVTRLSQPDAREDDAWRVTPLRPRDRTGVVVETLIAFPVELGVGVSAVIAPRWRRSASSSRLQEEVEQAARRVATTPRARLAPTFAHGMCIAQRELSQPSRIASVATTPSTGLSAPGLQPEQPVEGPHHARRRRDSGRSRLCVSGRTHAGSEEAARGGRRLGAAAGEQSSAPASAGASSRASSGDEERPFFSA